MDGDVGVEVPCGAPDDVGGQQDPDCEREQAQGRRPPTGRERDPREDRDEDAVADRRHRERDAVRDVHGLGVHRRDQGHPQEHHRGRADHRTVEERCATRGLDGDPREDQETDAEDHVAGERHPRAPERRCGAGGACERGDGRRAHREREPGGEAEPGIGADPGGAPGAPQECGDREDPDQRAEDGAAPPGGGRARDEEPRTPEGVRGRETLIGRARRQGRGGGRRHLALHRRKVHRPREDISHLGRNGPRAARCGPGHYGRRRGSRRRARRRARRCQHKGRGRGHGGPPPHGGGRADRGRGRRAGGARRGERHRRPHEPDDHRDRAGQRLHPLQRHPRHDARADPGVRVTDRRALRHRDRRQLAHRDRPGGASPSARSTSSRC